MVGTCVLDGCVCEQYMYVTDYVYDAVKHMLVVQYVSVSKLVALFVTV